MPLPSPARRTAAILAAAAVAASGIAIAATPSIALGADGGVVVNEIWYDGSPVDAIELYNSSAAVVDVSGWKVQDDNHDASAEGTGTIPAGTTLAPGAFLVLPKDATPLGFPFGLGKGDEVVLLDAADTVVDSYAYEATAPLSDWSRCADGGDWAHATEVTLGAANVCDVPAEPGAVLLNEIDSGPADWIELINPGDEPLDLSGYELRDNSDDHRWFFADGASIAAGARLVVEASTLGVDVDGAEQQFTAAIGIGGTDAIRLYDDAGTELDTYSWTGHPAIDGDEAAASWARCPDATGDFALAEVTPGGPNTCVLPAVAVNEVESNGDATDWVEVVNTGAEPVDLSGWTMHRQRPDRARRRRHARGGRHHARAGRLLRLRRRRALQLRPRRRGCRDHPQRRRPDGRRVRLGRPRRRHLGALPRRHRRIRRRHGRDQGPAERVRRRPGRPRRPRGRAWPGAADVTVLDEQTMFLPDSSGLDTQETDEGTFLWAVDNGTGTFWKLVANADGSVAFADGWEAGKRARFQRDADDPDAAGPDTEGITVDADGRVYLASERDNSDKAVNQNVVLAVDPDAPGPDVVADQEWDLTASLPQVAANTGIEAVEWVSDAALAGLLVDPNTGAPYDPADYPGHGDGLFFVAVEDNGFVYAYALGADGSIDQVASIDPGLGGVMALDYDTVLDELWAVCDNGCEGVAARIAFTGAEPTIVHVARPAGMPNLNNEGFATAPASLTSVAADATTVRPAWWFADGEQPAALRVGTLPGAAVPDPGLAPVVSATLDPAQPTGDNGWYTGPVAITATATDDLDPAPAIEANVDGAGWTPVTAPIELTADGEHTVLVRATDAAGNVSADTVVAAKVDATDPTVSGTLDGRANRLVITAADATSGVDDIEYRYLRKVGSRTYYTDWNTYEWPLNVSLGTLVKVEYRATDVAGNVGATGIYLG